MVGLEQLRRYAGSPRITPEVAAPFLEMEKDRHRQMQMRLLAGPAGAFFTHAAPVIPYQGHMQSISQAVPQMLGMHATPAADAAGSAASAAPGALGNMFEHLGPTLAMGSLGAGGAVLATYLASKLWNRFMRPKPQALKMAQEAILTGETTTELPMLNNVRLLKFATVGAHEGKVPVTLVGAVKTAAYSLGLLQEVLTDRKDNLAPEELQALRELDSSIKTASAIVGYLRGQTAELSKIATVEIDHIRKAASEGAADVKNILENSRTKVAAENELTGIAEVIAIPHGIMSKMAKSLDMLAVSPETAVFVEQGNPIGLTCGLLALMGQ